MTNFYLKVQIIEQSCLFELSWGKGQQLSITLPYCQQLDVLYQEWQSTYLSFYKTAFQQNLPSYNSQKSTRETTPLRGRVAASGNLTPPPIDWHAKLVQAEAKLLYEFHHWLRRGELFALRSRLAQAARNKETGSNLSLIEVFLTCHPLELARLPWESWEIGTEFATPGKVRFARMPLNIQETTVTPPCRRRARVLVILGDETGLNFQVDKAAVSSLANIAEIKFVGWQPGKDINSLKAEIVEYLLSEQGWDILFFAGHSNETILTGGELAIAPNTSLHLSEIAHSLRVAKERGLQFALFNSCNGLSLAAALIDLGLSQVAVMREPIHNCLAQEFLVRFLQRLGEYQDVHAALIAACQYLKLEKHLTYPSAYLIPSLFRHPEAPLFRLQRYGFKQRLQRWLPTKAEAIALAGLITLSLLPSVQDFLLERRIWLQAVYRHTTQQVPATASPPVLLVQIDWESLQKAKVDARKINPIDREYLASLVNQLSAREAKVIGLDYVLDSPTPEDSALAQAVAEAIDKQGTWFVFAALKKGKGEVGVTPQVASLNQSLQGYINAPHWYIPLLPAQADCTNYCPFSYLLALVSSLQQQSFSPELPQPQTSESKTNLRTRLIKYLQQTKIRNDLTESLHNLRLSPLTSFSRNFEQLWLYPIIDFSIPPHLAYEQIAAWQLLEDTKTKEGIKQQVVLIVPGGYDQAGVTMPGSDNFPVPMAIGYWQSQNNSTTNSAKFTGAEAHAYMLQHLLSNMLVIPLPDLWLVGIAVLLGKGMQLRWQELQLRQQRRQLLVLASSTVIYGLVGLQIHISAAVLIPLLLPSATFWLYLALPFATSRLTSQS
ncbi:MAG: CHASE2 domain-containing protein [Coleofasciculaceae cyanobacterium]